MDLTFDEIFKACKEGVIRVVSESPKRWGTHYDTIPHGNCYDPVHCDCECKGCALARVSGGTQRTPIP